MATAGNAAASSATASSSAEQAQDSTAEESAGQAVVSNDVVPSGAVRAVQLANQEPSGLRHVCEGPRCLCQRYENGELAVVVMNQNREETYQNVVRGGQRERNGNRNAAYLNPNYQNPVDLLARQNQQQEPEENIYERLDCEDDVFDDHMYEPIGGDRLNQRRIGNDALDRGNSYYNYQPRNIYMEAASRNIRNQFCPYFLGRNCFSSENIAYVSSYKRHIQNQAMGGHVNARNCGCHFCRHLCHRCLDIQDRSIRMADATMNNNRLPYIYQIPRSCRCTFCRGGEYAYGRFPLNSNPESLTRRDCQCRDPSSCTCRSHMFSNLNNAIYFGRLDQLVSNPLYTNPTIYLGRIDRPSLVFGLNALDENTATSNLTPAQAQPGTSSSSNSSGTFDPNVPSTSRAGTAVQQAPRLHTCDDSCIRNQGNDAAATNTSGCPLLRRCERGDCSHGGRFSVHWWFVNKWLPNWTLQLTDKNNEANKKEDEDKEVPAKERDESDSDDS